ncbi:2-succinyl-6-hydroxy-2,4-cyclohexadiene-1-carboxylate synthase [Exiguobacterium sp. K1]|uniref:2-succinyl-6-hydroxy-2, 4-cyclohexadiene-1-carboxylate synthase n=1 Tax=Exiguobacterium sp. K1 TaxID=2980105 RepID=UPI00299E659E|nr:2-succinyl-6-hydroxy-2,4-cyclohexadiene-1-carboxylate synthase [Exiguobacterium sp. K1]MDX1260499.1 2-succinyl-6-hydroxy-2,4-cyclohexadiene-1-carboxylate synthase [Exiguobacterium sp. K1]
MKLRHQEYHVEISGSGPPLLLLHGFTGSSATWDLFGSRLQSDFTVYRIDLLGHGRTASASYQRMRLTEQVKDLKSLLATREEDWSVLGYSMGGRIALLLAATSKQVKQTIAVSTTPGLRSAHERRLRRQADRRLADRLLTDGLADFIDYWESLPLFASQRHLPVEVQESIRRGRLAQSPEGLAASLIAQGTGNMTPVWHLLDTSSIDWIVGNDDDKFKKIAIEAAPSEKIHLIEGASHAPHIDQPEKFVTIVEKLLLINQMGELK